MTIALWLLMAATDERRGHPEIQEYENQKQMEAIQQHLQKKKARQERKHFS